MDDLTQIEENLREGLRPVSAPEGFTDRVMARVQARPQKRRAMVHAQVSRAGWLAIAAALILSITGGEVLHVHHQRQAQDAAQAELDRAMQLTSHAMNEVQSGFERSSAGRYARLWNGN